MKTLFLVRHGTVHNPQCIVYRRLPGFGLNSVGRQEAEVAAVFLRSYPIQVVYHSPVERTIQTAQIINQHHNAPLLAEPLLHEWDSEETSVQVLERMQRFWHHWLESKQRFGVAVSHRDSLRLLLFTLLGETPWPGMEDVTKLPLPRAGIYRIESASDRVNIDRVFAPKNEV